MTVLLAETQRPVEVDALTPRERERVLACLRRRQAEVRPGERLEWRLELLERVLLVEDSLGDPLGLALERQPMLVTRVGPPR